MKKLNEFHWLLIWIFVFILCYLPGFGWKSFEPLILGIPFWVWYTIAFFLIASVLGIVFVKTFWDKIE